MRAQARLSRVRDDPGTRRDARTRMAFGIRSRAAAVLLAVLLVGTPASAAPFAGEVVSFTPGTNAGFGADQLPGIVLGPPHGGGDLQGSLDVLSLGNGGSIVLGFPDGAICDGPGVDFTVFENAFRAGGGETVFAEVGIVAVSADGEHFFEFPYDPETFAGLAGVTPVYSNPDNRIDPTDPAVSGGDSFDLATVGLASASFVRITDPGAAIPDPGNRIPPGNSAGFDLDAVAVVHQCGAAEGSPTPTSTPSPPSSVSPTETESVSPTSSPPSPSPTAPAPSLSPTASAATTTPSYKRRPTPTPTTANSTPSTPGILHGDANGDGLVDQRDTDATIAEIFDGDGDSASAAAGGLYGASPGVDANGDGIVSVADLLFDF